MKSLENLGHLLRENEPLAPYTWLQIGGPARYFAEPTTRPDLIQLVSAAAKEQLPVRVLGGGSNLLIQESGCEGLVLHLTAPEFSTIQVQGTRLIVGGGAKLSHVITHAVGAGLAGLEHWWAFPVP